MVFLRSQSPQTWPNMGPVFEGGLYLQFVGYGKAGSTVERMGVAETERIDRELKTKWAAFPVGL